MTRIFIGGSRAVSKLNSVIRKQIDELMAKNCDFFIGDANGADKAVQRHLAEQGYPHVTVFCTETCRNNLGNWAVRVIRAPNRRKDFGYFAAKDRAMAREAQCGLMLWDGRSRGTLENILNLLEEQKRVRIYLARSKDFSTVSSEDELRNLVSREGLPLTIRRQTVLRV